MKLRELAFSDLYISVDCEAFLRGVPGQLGIVAPPEAVAPDLIGLHAVLSVSARERAEFSVRYDGAVYRVSNIASQQGRWWVCRRGMTRIPSITELGIVPNLADIMVSLGQDRGLFLIMGAAGQGKSTTAASIMASWLTAFGDVGVSIENPPEAPLEGPHGDAGWCFQIDVDDDRIADALAQSRRWRPKFMYLGEISSAHVATQAARCGSSQMAVVTTHYATTLIDGLESFLRLVEEQEGENAKHLLAEALTMCVHQRFVGDDRKLTMDVLLPSLKADDPIRAMIRRGDLSGVESHVRRTGTKKAGS